ncbi:reverse transcriptase [Penicillium maclennaniae]|uniref:reverse transcriptase n=1 Tax=Penicillium maclennaniae TaxID=1343394 RepID=UPI00254268BC|nr:reverse transcriptase [Penicillium maclennaniae]KAJ5661816.1 reverse transcriptase [Penicillium maclennaniae]
MDPYLSRTLQSLTRSKIHELKKQRSEYESRKAEVLVAAAQRSILRDKVACLLAGTKELAPGASHDNAISNIEHWIEQAKYDSSIPLEKLEEFETHLRNALDAHSRKLSLADLYSRLLTEWMNPPSNQTNEAVEFSSEGDDFLFVDERQKQRLKQLCDQFERTVFEPYETEPIAIDSFLSGLFPTEKSKNALESLRESIRRYLAAIWEEKNPFTIDSLSACIRGIQTEEIVSEEKQETLKHFLNSKVVLNEIADVLNMRYTDLKNWDWHADDEGVPVLPRQQLNGKYRIWMDDDVLETIFVEHICIKLCVTLKAILKDYIQSNAGWKFAQGPELTTRDRHRRQYYLEERLDHPNNVESRRKQDYLDTFFLASMPADEDTLAGRICGYDEDEDDGQRGSLASKSVKQQLLRKIVTETIFRRQFYGQAAVIQSDLQWYATSIPHSTACTILEFIGFSQDWIRFLRKYLETPLNMDNAFEGHEKVGPRKRRRGIPIAHASEKVIGELILFFMDCAVNEKTGLLLYRLHDDIWLSGDPEKCAQAWEVMQTFANITGLQFNESKSGSVCLGDAVGKEMKSRMPQGPVKIGFLMLDPVTGDWVIDHSQVDAHVRQLKTQLDNCNSVISWVRTWNSCIGRFFKNTFGEPAHCFGRPHIDAILDTYKKMYDVIFETENTKTGRTVADYLRGRIESDFNVFDVPDAFFFLPEKLGGLGLRNPFVSIFMLRDRLKYSPRELMDIFIINEREIYEAEKEVFEKRTATQQRRIWQTMENDHELDELKDAFPSGKKDNFPSFGEWSKFREVKSSKLCGLYGAFMEVPSSTYPKTTSAVEDAVTMAQSIFDIGNQGAEMKWTLYLYVEDLMIKFGGLNLVDKQFLPTGVLDMIRGQKVRWQMVL